MNFSDEVWTVDEFDLSHPEVDPARFDPKSGGMVQHERHRGTLRLTCPAATAIVVLIGGFVTCDRYFSQGETWRSPWTLTEVRRITVESDGSGPLDPSVFASLGMGAVNRAARRYLLDLARKHGTMYGQPTALPNPGPTGHPTTYYATWVDKYLTAVDQGRGYMKRLLAANPGYSRSGILRLVDRAEQLGLITDRPGQGAAGGKRTDACIALLERGN